jgi:hypothetical protein
MDAVQSFQKHIQYHCDEIDAVYVPLALLVRQTYHIILNLTNDAQPAVTRHTFGIRRKVLIACIQISQKYHKQESRHQPSKSKIQKMMPFKIPNKIDAMIALTKPRI